MRIIVRDYRRPVELPFCHVASQLHAVSLPHKCGIAQKASGTVQQRATNRSPTIAVQSLIVHLHIRETKVSRTNIPIEPTTTPWTRHF